LNIKRIYDQLTHGRIIAHIHIIHAKNVLKILGSRET